MKARDVIIGFVFLVVLIAGVFWIRNTKSKKTASPYPSVTPNLSDQISKTFNFQIPEGADKADLRDVSGGNGSGMATAKFEAGVFSSTVLADLPAPDGGKFYQAWLIGGKAGDNDYSIISLGVLRAAKGGYLVDFQSKTDYSGYKNVVVSLESQKAFAPSAHVLEGSF
jgi:hypothetical protein